MESKMTPAHGMTVVLEDCGQDFLEFDIFGCRIVDTRPFQGFVWNGKQIVNDTINVGDRIVIWTSEGTRPLLYPVIAVRPFDILAGAAAGGR